MKSQKVASGASSIHRLIKIGVNGVVECGGL